MKETVTQPHGLCHCVDFVEADTLLSENSKVLNCGACANICVKHTHTHARAAWICPKHLWKDALKLLFF